MKKSMKTSIKILTGCLFATLGLGTFAACASDKADIFPPYKPEMPVSEKYQDENVTLDGDFTSDAIWQGAEWHKMQSTLANRNSNNNVTELKDAEFRATAVVAESGIYLGVISNDPVVYVGEGWNDNSAPDIQNRVFGKTGVSMYVADARNRDQAGRFSYEIGFAADGTSALGYSGNGTGGYKTSRQGKIYTAAKVYGELNSDNTQGYAIEAFIPWSSMPGVDLNDKPEALVATFASHRYNNATPKENGLVWELLDQRYGQGWMGTASWSEYGANGVKRQAEGAVFGTYENYAYDAGFDVSGDVEGEGRKLTFESDPETRRQSYIYVRDMKDTELYAEARFTIGDLSSVGDQYPMLGFAFYGDPSTVDGKTATCAVYAGVTLDTQAGNRFNSTFTAAPLNGADFVNQRKYNTNDPFDPTVQGGFKVSVYRKGADFYIFYNDKLYDIKSFPYIQADTETFMGLFVINMPVTVTEYGFYAGEEAAAHGEDKIGGYVPKDYVIDGVADAKWEEYKGAVASLKTDDASGKTFTAKAVMGSNGLYLIAEAKHEYYFDNKTPNGEWANQYTTPGVEGVTNIAVVIGNSSSSSDYKLHFTISKYGVYACGGGTGANVIGTMKTTDSGAVGSKTRYTSVAECFIPAIVLESVTGGYADGNKDSSNIQLVFVSYNGAEKDNLETAANYRIAGPNGGTAWTWLWPLAVPKTGELNGFAHGHYMKVTAKGIEYPAAQAASVTKGDDVTVTGIEKGATYPCGDEITFNVSVADTHVITGITLNGKKIEPNGEGSYKFIYRGGALDLVVTSIEKNTKVTLGDHYGATVSVAGNADLTKNYDDGDMVTFTVTPDGYYGIVKVKVNGEEVTAKEGSTYERAFSITEGRFDITVETKLVKVDVTFTVADANGTPFDQRFSLKDKKLIFTNKNDSNDTFELTIGENNTTVSAASAKTIGNVYSVAVDGNLYNFSLADITIAGSVKDITLKLKSNLTIGAINNGSYAVNLNDGLSVTDILSNGGSRPASDILINKNLTGDVWFGAKIKMPKDDLLYGSGISLCFYTGSTRNLITIGHPEYTGATSKQSGVWKGVTAANGSTYLLTKGYEDLLVGGGLYVLVNRAADGTVNVYFVANERAEKVFTTTVENTAISSWGVYLNCIGQNRKNQVESLKCGASAKELLGNLLGTVGVKVNNSATDDTATVAIAGNPSEYEFGKTYTFTVTPKSSSYLVTTVTVNGTKVEADNGTYSFVFMGKTEIAVTTAEKGKVTLGNVSELVTVSVRNNGDLSHEYNSTDTVEFTVALKESGNNGYYKITVKVNGKEITGTDGEYSQVYGDTNAFEITVEAELIASDAKITVQPRNTGANGKTDGITLTFTNGSTSFTATADENGVINLTQKPLGTYTVRGRLFGGELKYPDVTLNARNNTAEITHNGTYLRYDEGNSAIVDYGTSSVDFGSAGNTVLLGTQSISGEVWFTMKVTMPNRSDWNNIRFIMAPENWNARDYVEFLHNENGFIKFMGTDATTIHGADIGNAMTAGTCYVAFARTADNKFKMIWAESAEGLKSATPVEYTSTTNGAAIGQIGFTSDACDGASVKYISSGATLDAAVAEMNAYEAKDKA